MLIILSLHGPPSFEREHEEIHRQLKALINSKGDTSKAAEAVAEVLHSHFEKEEKLASPVLGALRPYVEGKLSVKGRTKAAKIAFAFNKEYERMLGEHKAIIKALDELERTAKSEKRKDALKFVEDLKVHAAMEEEVLYPSVIMLGRLLEG